MVAFSRQQKLMVSAHVLAVVLVLVSYFYELVNLSGEFYFIVFKIIISYRIK